MGYSKSNKVHWLNSIVKFSLLALIMSVLPCSAWAQDIAVDPASFNYGDVSVDSELQQTFDVANSGTSDLIVHSITISGDDAGDFIIAPILWPFTVAPDDSAVVGVIFRPTSNGPKNAVLRIVSNDPDESTLDIPLSGNGTISNAQVSASVVPSNSLPYAGDELSAAIMVDMGGQLLQIYEATLCWDPRVLEYTGTSAGDQSWGNSTATSDSYVKNGSLCVDWFDTDSAGVAGEFVIINFNFKVIGAAGSSTLLDLEFSRMVSEEFPNLLNRLTINDGSLQIEGEDIELAIGSASYDYGSVEVNWSSSHTFAVSNAGKANLTIGPITLVGADADQFSIDSGEGISLAPGESGDIVVSFSPASAGVKNTTLRIESNPPDVNPLDVSLTGSGSADPVSDIAFGSNSYAYGDVIVGSSSFQTVVVNNSGTAVLDVDETILVGSSAGQFSITSGGAPFSIPPGASHMVEVQFTPNSVGVKNATLRITCNDSDESPADISLTGNGTNPSDIAMNPSSYDFGQGLAGSITSQTVVMSNQGTGTLVVSTVGTEGEAFTINAGDLMGNPFLSPGQSRNFTINFMPTSAGPKNGVLLIVTNDPDDIVFEIPVTGEGVTEPAVIAVPSSHDFANVLVGSMVSQTIVVSNGGTADLSVDDITLEGADADQFSMFIDGGPLPSTLEVGENIEVAVDFVPTSEGFKSAGLTIVSDDPDTNPLAVALSGSGIDPGDLTTLTLTANEDAYVASPWGASQNYGTASTLRARDSWIDYRSYMKFTVTGLDGPVTSAKLRLYVSNGSADGGSFYFVPDNSWNESNITSNNAPGFDGDFLGNIGSVSANTWVELDVATLIIADGTYSFGFSNSSSDFVYYSSKEGANPPELVTQILGGNALPVAGDDEAMTDEDMAVQIDVLDNDSDSNGVVDPTTVVVREPAANGSTAVDAVTGIITYTPNVDFYGGDQFSYTVRDDAGATSNEAVVTVTVNEVNDPPVADDDEAWGVVNSAVDVDVLNNDHDIDGTLDPNTVLVESQPSSGFCSVDPNTGAITYTPDTDFVGTDTFTYTARDDDGATSNEANVMVTITSGGSGTHSFSAIADAHVNTLFTWANYGSDSSLRVQDSWLDYRSYLKFSVTGLDGPVESAKLRLYVTDASPDGGSIYLVSDNSWQEGSITGGNAPALTGEALSSAGSVSAGTWVEFDVTSAITGDGTYSFGVVNSSSNQVLYSSKEGSNPPELIIDTGFTI